jgi:hypothetical protein
MSTPSRIKLTHPIEVPEGSFSRRFGAGEIVSQPNEALLTIAEGKYTVLDAAFIEERKVSKAPKA